MSLLVLLILLVFLSRGDRWSTLTGVWQQLDLWSLALAVLLLLIANLAVAWRCAVLMKGDGIGPRAILGPNVRIQFVALFIAHAAPVSALADFAKAALLKVNFQLSYARALKLVVFERMATVIGCTLIGVLTLPLIAAAGGSRTLVMLLSALWLAGLLGLVGILWLGDKHRLLQVEPVRKVAGAVAGLGRTLRTPSHALRLAGCSVAQLMLIALAFLVLARGTGVALPGLYVFLVIPFVFLISSLPVFYMGWGGRELALIAAFSGVAPGVTQTHLVALSIAFGAVVFLSAIPGAIYWLLNPDLGRTLADSIGEGEIEPKLTTNAANVAC